MKDYKIKHTNYSDWISGDLEDTSTSESTKPELNFVAEPDTDKLIEFPPYIALEITNVCNLKCTHCNYRYGLDHYTRDRGYAEEKLVKLVLEQAKEHGASVLMNYDGEPLMHKNFINYLKLAVEADVNTYFNTNATMLTKEKSDELLDFYKGSIFVSVDGDKEWFEKVRVGASFEKVMDNLNYLISANEKKGKPITIGVSLCNLGQSQADRTDFLNEWINRVDYVSMGEVNDKFGTIISDKMIQYKIKKRPTCSVPWETVGISHNGDVIPCSIYITRANTVDGAIVGNIFENSLKDIWNGEKMENFRQIHRSKNMENTYCDKCERWHYQFVFSRYETDRYKAERNGFWSTFQNNKSDLNFK